MTEATETKGDEIATNLTVDLEELDPPQPTSVDQFLEGDRGFLRPDGFYFQALRGVYQSTLDQFEAEGVIEVPLKPGQHFDWDTDAGEWVHQPIPREEQRALALAKVDQEHARYLVELTGHATEAERDTWRAKEEAALALDAGTATPGQINMLTLEADGGGVSVEELAARIIANADAFMHLAGVAAGLRAKGRALVNAATDEAVALADVEGQITAALGQLEGDVVTAIQALQAGG